MTWNTATPAGSDNVSSGDDVIREFKADVQTALTAEGAFPVSTSSPVFRPRLGKGTTASRPAAVDGGVYFNTDTKTIQRSTGAAWEDVGVFLDSSGNAYIPNELYGARLLLIFGGSADTTDRYLQGVQIFSSTETGYYMNRPGSIVGYSVGGTTYNFTSNYTSNFVIRKNGTDIITASNLTWTANNQNQFTSGTSARGTNTFVAGDKIELFYNYQSGTALAGLICYIEIQFDT